jgi:hypothetical protein
MWFDRVMSWAGGDDPETRGSKVRAFLIIFSIHMMAEFWRIALFARDAALQAKAPEPWWFWLGIALPAVAAVVSFVPKTMRTGFALWTALSVIMHIHFFPHAGNHPFLMLVIAALAVFFNLNEAKEQELFLQSVKWLLVLVFFYSGLQKLVHGYYFHATQFAYSVSLRGNYQDFFGMMMPEAEIERLKAFNGTVGEGPYTIDAPLVLIASNLTYITEMLLPILLLVRRTRFVALIVTTITMFLIQSAARELFFFGLFMSGLVLFFDRDVNRKLIPVFGVYYAWLVLMALNLIPRFWFG